MLDIDIPQEIDRLVGGHSNDFPFPFDDGDSFTPSDSEIFSGGPKYTPPMDYLADLGACVNPNSVMPLLNTSALLLNSPKIDLNTINFAAHSPPLSPKVEKVRTNLNFNNITNAPSSQHLQQHRRTSSPVIITSTIPKTKSIKSSDGGMIKVPGSIATADKRISQQISTTVIKSESDLSDQPTKGGVLHSIAPGIGGLTFANTIDYNKMKHNSNQKSVLNGNVNVKKERDSSPLHNMTTLHNSNYTHQHKLISRAQHKVSTPTSSPSSHHNHNSHHHHSHISSNQSNKKTSKHQPSPSDPEYPKPAYSYSCLIAMSLKNS